jgi:hypothetical protein
MAFSLPYLDSIFDVLNHATVVHYNSELMSMTGNPRVTPEVTRDVCLLARMMAANLYNAQIEDLMFEVKVRTHFLNIVVILVSQ